MAAEKIRTRILIISDTHAKVPCPPQPGGIEQEYQQIDLHRTPTGFRDPLPEADIVLHCGDLSYNGQPNELRKTFDMIKAIRAPLKLVIAGNHDLALDRLYCERLAQSDPRWMDVHAEALQIARDSEAHGIRYLDEGEHSFTLANGGVFKIYTSQWTPQFGGWAFQYPKNQHAFNIPRGMDVVMTHGPPYGVLDYAGYDGIRAGCRKLFQAVQAARPRIHCFGHIHEAWGAYRAQWRPSPEEGWDTAIDQDQSQYIARLRGLRPFFADDEETKKAKLELLKLISTQRGFAVDLTQGEHRIGDERAHTLFANAAIMDIHYRPMQCPWLIDLELPKAK